MKNKIYPSFDAAVADIPDGATIMFADFGGIGAPQNLIAALHRQGAKDLTRHFQRTRRHRRPD